MRVVEAELDQLFPVTGGGPDSGALALLHTRAEPSQIPVSEVEAATDWFLPKRKR
jgi:hypothetical protein